MSEDKQVLNDIGKVIAVLIIIAIVISIAAINLVGDNEGTSAAFQEKKVLDRIKPLGVVATTAAEAKEASPVVEEVAVEQGPMTAEQVYNTACMACHSTGAAGAPKTGDVAAWAPRIAQGDDVLFEHATKGFKGMPPRGGSPQLSDEDITVAIGFMVSQSQ
ncbi:MAG TPA: cytochrome c5 family protein [Cycloclasticus sp.]|nr:cytochrome c5 family protein [Cycloclasticus sp.]HIL94270.1 cytochrome c5 family protein [Cycloclasticus sp.]